MLETLKECLSSDGSLNTFGLFVYSEEVSDYKLIYLEIRLIVDFKS